MNYRTDDAGISQASFILCADNVGALVAREWVYEVHSLALLHVAKMVGIEKLYSIASLDWIIGLGHNELTRGMKLFVDG